MSQAATSPQLLRRVNVQTVLAALRGSGPMTVSDLIAATGLTRATVIAVCEDLIAMGWAHELENTRDSGGDYIKGRPARRFAFSDRAGVVVGVDLGHAKATTVVADLRGTPLARVTRLVPLADGPGPAARLKMLDLTIQATLAEVGVDARQVLAVTVGVPAPVSRAGDILAVEDLWKIAGVDARAALGDRYGWYVQMENDANLAVLAERWQGAGQGVADVVALLAGERLGAGVTESGRLLHGSQGGFGEMRYLNHVAGVGGASGIAEVCRQWAAEAVAGITETSLRDLCGGDPDALSAEMVFAAAAAGDAAAQDILGRVAVRMARVIATLAPLTDAELVVICGAVAPAAATLIDDLTRELAVLDPAPPKVVASSLGDLVVALGAVRHALNYVDDNAVDIVLPPGRPGPATTSAPENGEAEAS